jgi:hypothetical protein
MKKRTTTLPPAAQSPLKVKVYTCLDRIPKKQCVINATIVPPPQPRVLKAGWSIQTAPDVMATFGINGDWVINDIRTLSVPKWMKDEAEYAYLTYFGFGEPMKDFVAIDAVVALDQSGRVVPAYDPERKDVWFLFAAANQEIVFIYNGSQILPCKLSSSEEKPGWDEIWIDVKRVMSTTYNDRKELDDMISEYVAQL